MIITSDGNIPSKFAHSFHVMKMAQGFYDAGEEVELVSLLSYLNIKERIKIKNIYNFYRISKNIKSKFIPVFNKDFLTKTIGVKNFNNKAASYIAKSKPNFVYCRSYLTPYYSAKHGVPTIIETHTTNYDHQDLKKIYEIASNKSFLGLVTINEKIKSEHIKRGIPEGKILVLEDGVDLNQFTIIEDKKYWRKVLNLPPNKNIIMYSGSLSEDKGIHIIIETAEALNNNKEIVFILVGGDGEQLKLWRNRAKEKKLENIQFIGFVNNSEVPKYLKAADILFMPYDESIQYRVMDIDTTSPLKLFEYMASKRPIIASNISTIAKIVKNDFSAKLSSSKKNYESIIKELLNNKNKCLYLAENAFHEATKYTWRNRCKNILNNLVYNKA